LRAELLVRRASRNALVLEPDVLRRVDATINRHTVVGARYADATLAEIDSEEFGPGMPA
jgi:hypothetical protein